MAYYAHVDVWEKVARIAKANGCVVTIWIDDITISGTKVSKSLVRQFLLSFMPVACAITRRSVQLTGVPKSRAWLFSVMGQLEGTEPATAEAAGS